MAGINPSAGGSPSETGHARRIATACCDPRVLAAADVYRTRRGLGHLIRFKNRATVPERANPPARGAAISPSVHIRITCFSSGVEGSRSSNKFTAATLALGHCQNCVTRSCAICPSLMLNRKPDLSSDQPPVERPSGRFTRVWFRAGAAMIHLYYGPSDLRVHWFIMFFLIFFSIFEPALVGLLYHPCRA